MITTRTLLRLSTPYKELKREDLPKTYELESWENDDDTWFRHHGQIYNVSEFCVVGMPRIHGPYGGAQTASNGYFMIAISGEGKLCSVIGIEKIISSQL